MEIVIQDVRLSVRQLLKNKSFAFTAILSLALGIGATTAVFSVVYGVLMDPCLLYTSPSPRDRG